MDTGAIRLSTQALPGVREAGAHGAGAAGPTPAQGDFGRALQGAISDVQSLQEKAGELSQRLVTGEVADVHEVMIAGEEASVAFELMMEIRNKLLEAYQEIMRMQV